MKLILATTALLFAFTIHAQESKQSPTPAQGIDVQAKLQTIKDRKKFVATYDKFKDYTSVLCKPVDLLGRGEKMAVAFARGMGQGPYHTGPEPDLPPSMFVLTVGFGFNGKLLNEPPRYALAFGSDSNNWHFLKDHVLYALIDEERLNLGEGQHEGNIYLGGVSEQMVFNLSREQIEKFANGKSVEIQLGGFPRKLKPEALNRFRSLLTLTQ